MKRLTNKQAIKLFAEKRERRREFKKAEIVFGKVKERWNEARRITEIYKGRAIYIGQGHSGLIHAHGISNSRMVFVNRLACMNVWSIQCLQTGRKTGYFSFDGLKRDLITGIKEFLVTGNFNAESREPRRKK